MYEELSKEWQMTSEEIQNAIYKEWHKKYHQAASTKLQATRSPAGLNLNTIKRYK